MQQSERFRMPPSSFDKMDRLVGHLKPQRWQDPPPVRNFTVDECAPATAGASVDALHPSQMPLAADEIAFWPTDLKVLDGLYVKELTTLNLDGRQNRMLLPLFNRHGLRRSERLTPNTYRAAGGRSGPPKPVTFSATIDLGELTPVQPGTLSSSAPSDPSASARVPVYECSPRRRAASRQLRFDAVTLLETLIAKDEPIFRLLLSPFRELHVMHRQTDEVSCVGLFGAAALASRAATSNVSTTSFSLASCLAHWLGEPAKLSELNACARSILGVGPLYVPKCAVTALVNISGFQLGGVVWVQRMTPFRAGGLWPMARRQLVILEVSKNTGRRFDLVWDEKEGAMVGRLPAGASYKLLDEREYQKYRAWFP